MSRLVPILQRWRWPLAALVGLALASATLGFLVWSSLTFTVPHQEHFYYRDEFNRATVFVVVNLRTSDGPIAVGQSLKVASFQIDFLRDPPDQLNRIHLRLVHSWARGWDFNESGSFAPDERGSLRVPVQQGDIVFETPGVKEPWISLEVWNQTSYVDYGSFADRTSRMTLTVAPEDAYAQYSSRRWVALGTVLMLLWATVPIGVKNLLEIADLTS